MKRILTLSIIGLVMGAVAAMAQSPKADQVSPDPAQNALHMRDLGTVFNDLRTANFTSAALERQLAQAQAKLEWFERYFHSKKK